MNGRTKDLPFRIITRKAYQLRDNRNSHCVIKEQWLLLEWDGINLPTILGHTLFFVVESRLKNHDFKKMVLGTYGPKFRNLQRWQRLLRWIFLEIFFNLSFPSAYFMIDVNCGVKLTIRFCFICTFEFLFFQIADLRKVRSCNLIQQKKIMCRLMKEK